MKQRHNFSITKWLTGVLAVAMVLLGSTNLNAQYVVDFENETKGSYASGTVNLNGLNWNMTEALIGSAAADFKNGERSARLRGRNGSSMTMLEDLPNGLGNITFQYRRYGTDGSQQPWAAEYSVDGESWTQIGSTFTATADVQVFSEEVNVEGNVRLRIVLTTTPGESGDRRINVDDIIISHYPKFSTEEVPYNFNFETNPFNDSWFHWDLDGLTKRWEYNGDNDRVDMNAFIGAGSCEVSDDWLISPPLNLTLGGQELLNFTTSSSFSGTNLEVLYSNDYNGFGDPTNATWTTIMTLSPAEAGSVIGNTALQAETGNEIFVAFRYNHTSTSSCARWSVEDFSISQFGFVEDFGNFPETGASYNSGTFTGVVGNTWEYVNARGSSTIGDNSPGLQNNTSASLKTTISGGLSNFSFDYMQMFSTNVKLEVHINGELVTTVTSDDEVGIVKNSGIINVAYIGDFEIEFKQGTEPTGGQVAINDFSWNSYHDGTAEISEGAGDGFRFLASPVTTSYSSFLSNVWTQGATNSDHPDSGEPNIFTFNGNDENGYDAFTGDMDDTDLNPGQALIVYVFSQDEFGEPTETWPKVLSVTGAAQTADFNANAFLINDENTDSHKFNLIGNPFAESITFGDFSNVTSSGLLTQVWVYDHNFTGGYDGDAGEGEVDPEDSDAGGGWRAYLWNGDTGAGSLTDGVIAPFQAFFMRNTNVEQNRALTLNASMRQGDDGSMLYSNPSEGAVIQFASRINNNQISDAWLSFAQNATVSASDLDMESLFPLDYRAFLSMYIEADGKAFDIKNLPTELAEPVNLPLHIYGWKPNGDSQNPGYVAMGGDVEMIWPKMENIPHEWEISITDNETGQVIDLRETDKYEFSIDASKSNRALEYKLGIHRAEITEKSASRFTLTIDPMSTSTPIDNELPKKVALEQNYPNPFNPTTQINYDLPESADVRLEVFNIQGQRVATLVNGTQNAGRHSVNFDATHLASGVYLYRLQAGGAVLTRKMTLIK